MCDMESEFVVPGVHVRFCTDDRAWKVEMEGKLVLSTQDVDTVCDWLIRRCLVVEEITCQTNKAISVKVRHDPTRQQ